MGGGSGEHSSDGRGGILYCFKWDLISAVALWCYIWLYCLNHIPSGIHNSLGNASVQFINFVLMSSFFGFTWNEKEKHAVNWTVKL